MLTQKSICIGYMYITLPKKVHQGQSYGFSISHVWMWELDHKESWVHKNWCFWTMVLEKTPVSPLGCQEIKPFNSKESVLINHWKDWCWSWNSNTLSTWCEELTHWKRTWFWQLTDWTELLISRGKNIHLQLVNFPVSSPGFLLISCLKTISYILRALSYIWVK